MCVGPARFVTCLIALLRGMPLLIRWAGLGGVRQQMGSTAGVILPHMPHPALRRLPLTSACPCLSPDLRGGGLPGAEGGGAHQPYLEEGPSAGAGRLHPGKL